MDAEIEKEIMELKAASNGLAQRTAAVLATSELLAEYRQINMRLLAKVQVLCLMVKENEKNLKPNARPVPITPP